MSVNQFDLKQNESTIKIKMAYMRVVNQCEKHNEMQVGDENFSQDSRKVRSERHPK